MKMNFKNIDISSTKLFWVPRNGYSFDNFAYLCLIWKKLKTFRDLLSIKEDLCNVNSTSMEVFVDQMCFKIFNLCTEQLHHYAFAYCRRQNFWKRVFRNRALSRKTPKSFLLIQVSSLEITKICSDSFLKKNFVKSTFLL